MISPETVRTGLTIDAGNRVEQYQVIDTWNVMGMRGTGSHDVSVTDVFVPKTRAAHHWYFRKIQAVALP